MFCADNESNLLVDLKQSLPQEPAALLQKLFITDILDLNALDQQQTRRVIEITADDTAVSSHSIPSLPQLISSFTSAVQALQGRDRASSFDKDDHTAMQFVVSAANLRAYNYSIELLSAFAVKEIAGNIIPAVATTNSIAAGLQVSEAVKLALGQTDLRNVWISEILRSKKFVIGGGMPKPSEGCYTCGRKVIEITVNVQTTTLRMLIDDVLLGQVNMQQPSLEFKCRTLYETGDDLDPDEVADFAELASRTLSALGITDSSYLRCSDQSTDLSVALLILDSEALTSKREVDMKNLQ
jgi:ubiquitin-like 1-activating enzyme E1 B